MKSQSVFFNDEIVALIQRCDEQCEAKKARQVEIIEAAKWWKEKSYDELWNLMFSSTIKRSWMVLSNGYCPVCGESVPMYDWIINAFDAPWKVQCPHCRKYFPQNDFKAFYESGLDEQGIFSYQLADRTLLVSESYLNNQTVNTSFIVDDGNGYIDNNGTRWMFIGTYLVYGQWKQLILKGVKRLAEAYIITGDPDYARRAAIIIDRIADMYPDFDYTEQGVMYEEERTSRGYVSYWADCCVEVRDIAIAYDQIFDEIKTDKILVDFLKEKAMKHKINNSKGSFERIQQNIEERIFRHTLDNTYRILSNFPETDITITVLKTVLDWPGNREEIEDGIQQIIMKSTLINGLTGEKGLAGYSTIGPKILAGFISFYSHLYPEFIRDIVTKYPVIHDTYRFHIDTWYLGKYYPGAGDMGSFGKPIYSYGNGICTNTSAITRLTWSNQYFLWKLYEITKDDDLARVIYISNGKSAKGCFENDLMIENPYIIQHKLENVIKEKGMYLDQKSVNKDKWRIALLYSGQKEDKRCFFIDYDSGGNHGHHDAMNIGLFAKGIDLMPDFGYPPVNRGGWASPSFFWYHHPASHNSVTIDGKMHTNLPIGSFLKYPQYGECKMWAIGEFVKSVYVSAPEYIDGKRYERLIALVDLSEKDCYCIDIFRVEGGKKHERFIRSFFSTITTGKLNLSKKYENTSCETVYEKVSVDGHNAYMRNFMYDNNPENGWFVDFKIDDRYKVLNNSADIHLRYTDLTKDASLCICESWIDTTDWSHSKNKQVGNREDWIPTIIVKGEYKSTFAGILEPYEGKSNIFSIKRLELLPYDKKLTAGSCQEADLSSNVAIEVISTTGTCDYIIAVDPCYEKKVICHIGARGQDNRNNSVDSQDELEIETDAWLLIVRKEGGKLCKAVICHGTYVRIDDIDIKIENTEDVSDIVEVKFTGKTYSIGY